MQVFSDEHCADGRTDLPWCENCMLKKICFLWYFDENFNGQYFVYTLILCHDNLTRKFSSNSWLFFYRMLWNVKLSVSGIVMSRTAKLPSPEEPGLTLPPPQPQWDPPSGVWEKWRTCKKSLINKKVQAQDLKKCCLFASNPRSKCAWTNCDVFPWIKHFAYDPRNVPVHPGVASRNPILSAFITEGNDANQLHPI